MGGRIRELLIASCVVTEIGYILLYKLISYSWNYHMSPHTIPIACSPLPLPLLYVCNPSPSPSIVRVSPLPLHT